MSTGGPDTTTIQPDAQREAGGRAGCMKAFLPSTLGVCAIVLGTAANVYCETIKFVNSDNLVLYAGPWSYRTRDTSEWIDGSTFVYTTCRYYNYLENDLGFSFTVDATTRAVWSFSIITPVVGALVLVGACLAPCMSFGDARWKAIGCMLITLSLFQGLTLMIESSSICNDNPVLQYIETNPGLVGTFPDSCEWATGYTLNIIAVVLWFLAGLSCYIFPAPKPVVKASRLQQEQTVTYQQNADGTVTETNVVIQGKPV